MIGYTKSRAYSSVSASILAFAAAAFAQPALAQSADEATASVDEIVVTGSRIVRDGFSAPTPTTVFSQQDIQATGLPNIADVVNQLPALQGSNTPQTGNTQVADQAGGQNIFNLRGLGAQRTLVLLDGRRVVPTTGAGTTDINNLPSFLVQRVDIVTGGASAAYGSDAVAGVVNFVLDRNFQGLKGQVEGGITSRGDNAQYGGNLTYGTGFAGGRGRVLLSTGGHVSEGVFDLDPKKRSWYKGIRQIANPAFVSRAATPNQPALITREDVNWALAAPGGLITSGPLKGTQFGPGGTVLPFQYGSLISGQAMVGGQNGDTSEEIALLQRVDNANVFGRVSYEINDSLSAYAQLLAGYSRARAPASSIARFFGNLTMNRANPYIPASVVQALTAAGATTFSYGLNSADLGRYFQDNIRETRQFTVGLEGAIFGDWKWDAYYQYGRTSLKNQLERNLNNTKFLNAIDVITGPNGQPVCRSFATNPSCVPLNVFGTGVADPAAIPYFTGSSENRSRLEQQVAEASISGEPFSLWAGPVSLVAGLGYRSEEISTQYIDPTSLTGAWSTANFKPNNGRYNVKEAFAETVVPLAKDSGIGDLELNGAARITDYSTSGTVVTWKGGVNFRPIQDLLLRGSRSRDIRAPGLLDLFAGGSANVAPGTTDPKYGNQLIAAYPNFNQGNPSLSPEKADALGLGVVYQPSWLSGFSVAFDYYRIKIKDGISAVPTQVLINDCFAGVRPDYCAFVTRGPGFVGGISVPDTVVGTIEAPQNLAAFKATGYDIEASYRKNLSDWVSGWNASMTLRGLATRVLSNSQDNGLGVVHETAGENGGFNNTGAVPRWRVNAQLTYAQGPITISGNWRHISSGVLYTSFYDTASGPLTNDMNRVSAADYFDLGVTYRFKVRGSDAELYARGSNIFDEAPPAVATTNLFRGQYNAFLYDTVGRTYLAGLRFRM